MDVPAVTIIIPCFNYGRFVGEAVRSALGQVGADVRVVIVDDGSTDGSTPAVCDSLAGERVEVIHQENRGPAAARNRGAKTARTPLLVFLDADDTIDPKFVATLWAAMEAEGGAVGKGEAGVSHAYCQEVLTDQAHGTWRVGPWDPTLLMITNLHPITALLRRDVFEEVGGFEESLGGNYEDWDFWLKVSFHGYRGVRVREPLFFWRRHSPDTMVMRAVQTHDATFAKIVERHHGQYEARSLELVKLSNSLLRKFDCNWIDETGFPIPLQYFWGLQGKLEAAEARAAALEKENAAHAEARAAEAKAGRQSAVQHGDLIRQHYESYAVVRFHRAWHRFLARMPGPVAWLPRQAGRLLRAVFLRG